KRNQRATAIFQNRTGQVAQYLQKLYDAKQIDMDAIWCIGADKTHPGDDGYRRYFEAAREGYEQAVAQGRICVLPAKPVFGNSMSNVQRTVLVNLSQIPEGWARQKTFRTSMWFDGLSSRWMTDTLVADVKNRKIVKPLEITFQGTMVGIFGEMDENAVSFRVWIDGQAVLNRGSEFWELNPRRLGKGDRLFYWQVIKHDLKPGKYTLKIEPHFLNSVKKGDLRIESVCAAE
ncbi:MAG: hypothetical protein JKX85_04340, partial [Phycisphaeraceae bacterium]|nr:hypothetical protein [Phycisphaeraceae bacterium]